jgi:hypothetical protein
VSVHSDLERRIQTLDPKAFEALVFDLVLAECPAANAVAAPDGGADVVVPAADGRRTRVWQAKRHVPRIMFAACEQSLSAALATHDPESVIFVFAKDLTANEMKVFEARLRQVGVEAGVDVSYWGLSALRARVQDNPKLRVRHLSYDEQTLLDIFASQRSGASAVERTFGLRDVLGAEDPAYEYTVELQSTEFEPRVRPTDRVTLLASDGDQHLRLAANPRDPNAGPIIRWRFTEDEAGHLAREEALRAVARGDQEITVEAGFKADVVAAPKVMRESVEKTTPASQQMRVVFRPGPPIGLSVVVVKGGVETSRRELNVYPFPPSGAFTHCYVGLGAGFMPFLGFRVMEGDPRIQVVLAPMLELGDNASENAAATRFNLDLVAADDVLLAGPLFPEHLEREAPVQALMPESIIQLTEYWSAMYESVVYLQDQLGITIPVHPPPFTLDELLSLNNAVETARSREFDAVFREADMNTPAAGVRQSVAFVLGNPMVTFRVIRNVFGTVVDLGQAVARLPEVRVVELPSLLVTPNPTTRLKVIAVGDGDMHCRLLAPDEAVPDGAFEVPPPE